MKIQTTLKSISDGDAEGEHTPMNETIDPASELMFRQVRHTDQMVWFAVLLLLAGALTGLGYQLAWWWMAVPSAMGVAMAWAGYRDARRQWLAAIADTTALRHTDAERRGMPAGANLDTDGGPDTDVFILARAITLNSDMNGR